MSRSIYRFYSRGRGSSWKPRAESPPSLFSSDSSIADQPSQVETLTQTQSEPQHSHIQADAESSLRQETQKQTWNETSNISAVQHDVSGDNNLGRNFTSNEPQFGMPRVAEPSHMTAPVHIDVGGTIYTTSMETLIVFPDSRLGKMFSGSIPVVLDTLKQHYFIDRDGAMFRHILNYLRNRRIILPDTFPDYDLLYMEATYFGLDQMRNDLTHWNLLRQMRNNVEHNYRIRNIFHKD